MPKIVKSWLIPSQENAPGIAFQYEDGVAACSDARSNDIDILDAIDLLSDEGRIVLAMKLEAAHAVDRTRH